MKRPKLNPEWRKILRHAWSIRLLIVAGVLSAAEVALPLIQGILPVPTGVFAALSGLATAGAFVTRLLAQKQFGGD